MFDGLYPLFLKDVNEHFEEESKKEVLLPEKAPFQESEISQIIKEHSKNPQKHIDSILYQEKF